MEIHVPDNTVAVVWVTYVHGVGGSMRAASIPGSDPEGFMRWLDAEGLRCEHSVPALFVFQAYFPSQRPFMYHHVTANMHEVSEILAKPGTLRALGKPQRGALVPVDPVDGSLEMMTDEFNNWVEASLGVAEPQDFSVLNDVSFDGIEDMLRQAANNNNDDQEGYSE